ncbi:AMP-binding protein, partial [Streptomyces boncukensis]
MAEDADRPLHRAVEARAARDAAHPAVVTGDARTTYGELDRRAGRLAEVLRGEAGVSDGETVAVCTEGAVGVLAGVLGTLKAGGAYAVVGPHEPDERLHDMLEEAGATVVVTDQRHRPRIDDTSYGLHVVLLDGAQPSGPPSSGPPPSADGGAELERSEAVLFSAGTATGQRRAVRVRHGVLCAARAAWAGAYALAPRDRLLTLAPPDTVEFTGAWIRALSAGATLVAPGSADPRAAAELVAAEGVTVLEGDPRSVAETLEALVPSDSDDPPVPEGLRMVVAGGERLTLREQLRFRLRLAGDARVLNVYGCAETAGCGTCFEPGLLPRLPESDGERKAVSYLGKPFPGWEAELREGRIWLRPPGGEDAVPTEDLGAWTEEGLLEFRGRESDRVTAAGRDLHPYRLESELAAQPMVREAVVTASGGERCLVYVVPERPGFALNEPSLKSAVARHVREESTLVAQDALPRNRAGRIDRRALPRPVSPRGGSRAGGKGGAGGAG